MVFLKIHWRIILVLVTVLILYLTLMPAPPSDGQGWDKLHHALAMAAVTVIAFRTIEPAQRAILLSGVYALVLGGLIEILQGCFTTTRSAEWGDFAADAVGVVIAMLGIYVWKRKAT